jgi:L-iditol 2-dehydrogenase
MALMRAVVLGSDGEPAVAEVDEPTGGGERVRVLACGLCGSDVEKIGAAPSGTVLGHEVVAETADGQRVVLVHHQGCGDCSRCRRGHEPTCERFPEPTIVPGGLAERTHARAGWVPLPDAVPDAVCTYVEPLACVLRAVERVPRGRVVIVGNGFIGRLFGAVLTRRGDDVCAVDHDPARSGAVPEGPVDHAVVCAPGALADAMAAVEPGGAILVFATGGETRSAAIYRRELTVVGSRSATRRHMEEAVALLPSLDVPEPTVLPLERFAEGLELHRRRRALKVVFTP